MKKNFITTLVLAVFLGSLFAWYFIYEKKIKTENKAAEEKAKQFVTLEKAKIREIRLVSLTNFIKDEKGKSPPEFKTIVLKKTGEDWHLTEPIEDFADNSSVRSLLSSLTTSKQERTVEEKPKDFEKYGLNPPRYKITVQGEGGEGAQEIHIGKETPIGYSVYVKFADSDPVYRASRSLNSAVEKKIEDFRNKKILRGLTRSDVSEMEIQVKKASITFKRDKDKKWLLTRDGVEGDGKEVGKTLGALVGLQAESFVSEGDKKLSEFGLHRPAVTAVLTHKGKRTSVLLAKKANSVYVKRADKKTVYKVKDSVLEDVQRNSKDYWNRDFADFNRFDIKHIVLERGKDSLVLSRPDKDWTVPADPNAKIDSSKIDELLASIQDIKIMEFLPRRTAAMGLAKPKLTIRLSETQDGKNKDKDKEPIILHFGAKKKKQIYAERKGFQYPLILKWEDFEKIDLRKAALVKAEKKTEAEKEVKSSE